MASNPVFNLTVTDSGTVTLDCNNQSIIHISFTATGNTTLQFSNTKIGSIILLMAGQDTPGGHTIDFNGTSTVKWGNNNTMPTLTTIPNRSDSFIFGYGTGGEFHEHATTLDIP